MPNQPGVEPPPVESILLLLLAERVWQRFGRNLVLLELAFYLCFLGVLTAVAVDRVSPRSKLARDRCGDTGKRIKWGAGQLDPAAASSRDSGYSLIDVSSVRPQGVWHDRGFSPHILRSSPFRSASGQENQSAE